MAEQDAALKRVERAFAKRATMRAEAQRQLVEAVRAARDAGCSLEAIGKRMGMSHAAVSKMLNT